MTKTETLLTLWDSRPRRVVNFDSPDDRVFLNSILVALKEAAPAIKLNDAGPLPDPNGDWFLTYTGRKFYPTNPKPEDVCIEDIAHHLSRLCRFGGASGPFYSIAQHSIIVASLVQPEFRLLALMHDATEAYCNDIVRPLKYAMPRYLAIEDLIWLAVAEKFNLPINSPTDIPEIKQADNVALMTERRDLLTQTDYQWSLDRQGYKPAAVKIIPMASDAAEQAFLAMFHELTSLSRDLVTVETPSNDSRSMPETAQNNHTQAVNPNTVGTVSSSDQTADTVDKPASGPAKPVAAPRPKTNRATPPRKPSRLPAARSLASPPPAQPQTTAAA